MTEDGKGIKRKFHALVSFLKTHCTQLVNITTGQTITLKEHKCQFM